MWTFCLDARVFPHKLVNIYINKMRCWGWRALQDNGDWWRHSEVHGTETKPNRDNRLWQPDVPAMQDWQGRRWHLQGVDINYQMECQLCPDGNKGVYLGESARNLYTEHLSNYKNSSSSSSFMMKDNEPQGLDGIYTASTVNNTERNFQKVEKKERRRKK